VTKTNLGAALAALMILAPAAQTAEPAKQWRGLMVDHHGEMYFYPCGENQRFEPEDATREKDLEHLFREFTGDLEQPVFMELEGAARGKTLRVTRLLRANPESAGCRENLEGVVFKAFGNEPDWRMAMDGRSLRFQRLEDAVPASFPSQALSEEDGRLVFEARTESGDMRVELTRERCRDSMLGAVYPLKAAVVSRGQSLQGCAYLGRGR
jgi:uncharacterized membrane protein